MNNDGSHFATEGRDAGGASVPVPLFEHVVALDVYRTVVDLEYAWNPEWSLRFRLPFEVRVRQAEVRLVDPATADERAAMQRALDLHHPEGTLEGIRDLEVAAARFWRGTFRERDRLEIAAGVTLPTGRTEENPFRTDALGNLLPHEHQQFGTGTVDPLLQVGWLTPLGERWRGDLYAAAHLPLYENDKGYRAPREFTVAGGIARALGGGWHLRGSLLGTYSGYAEWDEVRYVNSGWYVGYAGLAAEHRTESATWSLSVQAPFGQKTLGEGEETFDLGWVISLGAAVQW